MTGSNAVDSHGNFIGCSGQGGTWIDHSFFTQNGLADWSSQPNQSLANFTFPSATVTSTPNPNLTLDVPLAVWNWAFKQTTPVSGPWHYGNYGGPGGMGAPIDDADAGAMMHDYCYYQGGFSWSSNFTTASSALQACNQALCDTEQVVADNLTRKQFGVEDGTNQWRPLSASDVLERTKAEQMVGWFMHAVNKGNACH